MDALDECPNTSGIPSAHEQVLDLMKELVSLQILNLHICVTSHPEVDICFPSQRKRAREHQYLYGLLDGGCTTWLQVAPPGTTHKVSNLACPQAMSNPSTSFLQSDDQQAGQVQKVIQVQVLGISTNHIISHISHMMYYSGSRVGGDSGGTAFCAWRAGVVLECRVPWVEVGGMGLPCWRRGRLAIARFCAWYCSKVVLAWWWHGAVDGRGGWAVTCVVAVGGGVGVTSQWCFGMARLMLGCDVGGGEQKKKQNKNKTKQNALNEVGSHVGSVGGNASGQRKRKRLVGSERVGVLVGPVNRIEGVVVVVEVDGDRGREFMAELSCGRVLVVEVDGDGDPQAYVWRGGGDVVCEKQHEEKKEHLPVLSLSAGVLGGFAQRGDGGGGLEAMAGAMGRCVARGRH
ncbi:hypothetical protein EDB83DRAFT_2322149 [Lactarius deliciosus]|nr:hypothetical protein EDB83DRAFT_2322149 [Lactarius deliciosus]